MPNSSIADDGSIKLFKLRLAPDAAINDCAFVVAGSAAYGSRTDGGPCTISCEPLSNDTYQLTPSGGSGDDFYFPYVPESMNGGVGLCRVPIGAPDGTVVLTGAMNGCSLDIRQSGSDLVFRHVANGVPKPNLLPNDPHLKCRIDVRHYMLPQWEENIAASVGERSTRGMTAGAMPMHYLISVKQGGRWLVLNSGLLQVTSASRGQTRTSYERLRSLNSISPIVSSF